jgi:hypothetical protein
MHINRSALSQQQHRVRRYAASQNAFDYFNMLTSSALLETQEALLPDNHRERLFPPTETLYDPTGLPVDFRYMEVNPAFEQ